MTSASIYTYEIDLATMLGGVTRADARKKGVQEFLSVDPLASSYPSQSPYNFVLNRPTSLVDPDGRAPQYPIYGSDGKLIGYVVEPGQGPTQIAADLNTYFGCELTCDINYQDIVLDNPSSFSNVINSNGEPLGIYDEAYKSGNIKPGDILLIGYGSQSKAEASLILVQGEALQDMIDSVQEVFREDVMWLNIQEDGAFSNTYDVLNNASAGGRFPSGGAGAAWAHGHGAYRKASDTAREGKVLRILEEYRDSILSQLEPQNLEPNTDEEKP